MKMPCHELKCLMRGLKWHAKLRLNFKCGIVYWNRGCKKGLARIEDAIEEKE
jgi:hypothetical protein